MSDLELCYLPATEAIARFKAKTLSPVELMKAVIDRAEKVEKKINAFPLKFYDRALEQAKKAEEKYAKTDSRTRPLEGLPVAIKDEALIKGERVTFGSLIYKDYVAEETNPSIGRLLKAGAIMHARSAAPEFSCAPYTHSRINGVTSTPWNTKYSCGGSSGGSGASLAAGTSQLASGSDIGGSIRIPASMCGVVGFKPPFGRNPDTPPFNLDQYCHVGPMARTVADAALMQNLMCGPHPEDVASLRPKLRIPATLGDVKGWHIALCVNPAQYDLDPDVVKNTRAAADLFRAAGAVVEEVDLGWKREDVVRAADAHFGTIFGPWIGTYAKKHGKIMTDYALAFARESKRTKKEDFLKGLEIETNMYKSLGPILEKYRILLCPTLPLPATKAGESYVKKTLIINRKPQASIAHWLMTICFNIMSRCPVMSMPSGLAANGVPTGLSIVGRTYDDVSVFRAAAAFERERPWYRTAELRPKLLLVAELADVIYLLRHGETEWNVAQRLQGQLDSPLTPRGLEQARLNGAFLRSTIGDPSTFSLVSSPLGRARKTAEIIGEVLSMIPSFDARLVEIGLGEWDGLTFDQVNARVPGAWNRSNLDGSLFSAPGGETYDSMVERLSECLAELRPPTIVVSHGVAIRFLRGLFLKLDRPGIFGLQSTRQDGVFRLLNRQVDFLEPLRR